MKRFEFKPEDFLWNDKDGTGISVCCCEERAAASAAKIANQKLDKMMGRFELATVSPDYVDIEPYIEHSYKPKL